MPDISLMAIAVAVAAAASGRIFAGRLPPAWRQAATESSEPVSQPRAGNRSCKTSIVDLNIAPCQSNINFRSTGGIKARVQPRHTHALAARRKQCLLVLAGWSG